jgi:hypothetical protein
MTFPISLKQGEILDDGHCSAAGSANTRIYDDPTEVRKKIKCGWT